MNQPNRNEPPNLRRSPPHKWRDSRRFFLPIVAFFFSITLLLILTTVTVVYIYSLPGGGHMRGRLFPLTCLIPILFVIVTFILGSFMFRRFGRPMAQIFSAIDAVAEGNLSVRVSESKSPQFRELTRRFNRMVTELERSDQQRRHLTADIAHELRTPLHIIQGNLEGVLDGVYEATPDHINNTLEETKLLARLVNDLQTLSLAETGQLPLHPTRFLLADLIHDLTSSFTSQAASLGIDLKTDIADSTQEITADYDRLNQVLSNLVANAMRHTPKGGQISIETESGIPEGRSVRIKVKDTGAGIASEDLPFIFDRFWRGDKSRSDRIHSGLGLAIARQLIQAHGGTIEAQSEIGKGATFTIDLPLSERGL
jgi:signal transduction histidine kinase